MMMTTVRKRDRDAHIAWSKRRALFILGQGRVAKAVASMRDDLAKHPDCVVHPLITAFGMIASKDNDEDNARRFIEGFR